MGKVITLFKLLPKMHQALLIALFFTTLIIVFFPSEDAEASKQTQTNSASLQLNKRYQVPLAFRTPDAPDFAAASQSHANKNEALAKRKTKATDSEQENSDKTTDTEALANRSVEVKRFEVKSGDTLAALFDRAGLTPRDVYEITLLPLAKKNLLKIMPGEFLSISKNAKGYLTQVEYHLDAISTLFINSDKSGYSEHIVKKQVETRNKFANATIQSNFWNSGIDAGLTPNQIMQLATIFGWDIDFALDLRKGDSFSLLFEEEYADGEFLRNGNILAAEFTNQGDRFTAVRYTNGQYYSESGRSMRKAFLRSPVDFKYVSSNFNPRRLHPVTGQVKAHRGVDYVAAIGTPIKAAGSGRVIKSSYNKYNGNYVFIKHNDTYTTKYLHLTKRKVKQGQSVKQGQIIGTLGRTGRVTGAHLHYEFIVNGVHRNPRTIKLPKAQSIAKKDKAKFMAISDQLMAKLEHNKQIQLAMQ